MSDVRLRWDPAALAADVSVEANDLARDDGLQTAILLSLFLDRRAADADVLPAGATERRGWWGDALPVVDGDLIGSRLWLLAREKERASLLPRVEEYVLEALAWLIEDRVASKVEVTASIPRPGWLAYEVAVHRPQADPARYRFAHTWSAEET